jgi:hypothetical protein
MPSARIERSLSNSIGNVANVLSALDRGAGVVFYCHSSCCTCRARSVCTRVCFVLAFVPESYQIYHHSRGMHSVVICESMFVNAPSTSLDALTSPKNISSPLLRAQTCNRSGLNGSACWPCQAGFFCATGSLNTRGAIDGQGIYIVHFVWYCSGYFSALKFCLCSLIMTYLDTSIDLHLSSLGELGGWWIQQSVWH